MAERMKERRACERFVIPGAVVNYRLEGFLRSGKYREESFPIFDISRGGLRFVSDILLKADVKLTVRVTIPGGDNPLILHGKVRWVDVHPGKSYKYQIGVQFAPYGKNKGENDSEALRQIIALEAEASKK